MLVGAGPASECHSVIPQRQPALKIVTDAYVLPIPQGWAAQNTGRTIAVYRPDGVGAINISRMRRPGKPATENELREYLADDLKADGAKVEPVRIGAFTG